MKNVLLILLMQISVFTFGQDTKYKPILKEIIFEGVFDHKNEIVKPGKDGAASRILTKIIPNKPENIFKYMLQENNEKGIPTSSCYLLSKNEIASDVDLFKFSINPYEVFYNDPRLVKAKQNAEVEGKTIKVSIKIKETPVNLNTTSDNFAMATGGNDDCICTDWYWDYYHNDEFLYTEFDHTDCYCFGSAGGGGLVGGGSGGGQPTTLTCEQQTEEFANQGSAMEGPVDASGGIMSGDSWLIPYNWKIFSAGTWGLLSYEKGSLVKRHYDGINQDRWEYETFVHERIADVGASIGGIRTFQDLGATINITETKMSAYERIDFSVTNSVAGVCSGLTIPYNANKKFSAPNQYILVN